MIEVGDLVRFRDGNFIKGVWLVLKIGGSNRFRFIRNKTLCAKGSKRIWAYYNELEKL